MVQTGKEHTISLQYSAGKQLSFSLYFGLNGEGKSYAMRMLQETIHAMQSGDTGSLRYQKYELSFTVGDEGREITFSKGDKISHDLEKNQIPYLIFPEYAPPSKRIPCKQLYHLPKNSNIKQVTKDHSLERILRKFSTLKRQRRPDENWDGCEQLILDFLGIDGIMTAKEETIFGKNSKNPERMQDVDWLSSGQARILYTMTFIVIGAMCLKRKGAQGILMLDEPETSLHPAWQQEYVPLLCSILGICPHTISQCLISTHSPLILNSLPAESGKVYSIHAGEDVDADADRDSRITEEVEISSGWNSESVCSTMGLTSTRSKSFNEAFTNAIEQFSQTGATSEFDKIIKGYNLPTDDMLFMLFEFLKSKDGYEWRDEK